MSPLLQARWAATLAPALASFLLALTTPAWADPEREGRAMLGADLLVAGQEVEVREPVSGDLLAAGGRVDVGADVGGDVLALGGQMRLRARAGQSVYAAGGQLEVAGRIGRNLRVVGGQVQLLPGATVAGNVSAAGGQVSLRGEVLGHVQVAGGKVLIDGPVAGDVIATSGELSLGPDARIAGALRYRSGEELLRSPQAEVGGGIEKLVPFRHHGADADEDWHHRGGWQGRGFGWGLSLVWTIGLMAVATLLLMLMPRFSAGVSRSLRHRPGQSLLLGIGLLAGVPLAVVILCVTVIGLPLALAVLASYLALLPLAYVGGAIAIGDAVLDRGHAAPGQATGRRILAACAALLLLALAGFVPVVGGLLALGVLLAGLGGLALQLARPLAASR